MKVLTNLFRASTNLVVVTCLSSIVANADEKQLKGQSTSSQVEPASVTPTGSAEPSADRAVSEVLITSSNLIGATVRNSQDEPVGEINKVFISSDRELVHAVVDCGGFLGLGTQRVAIPIAALRLEPAVDDGRSSWLTTTVDLSQAPALETTELLELLDPAWLSVNAKFFDVAMRLPENVELIDLNRLIDQEVYGVGGESLAYLRELVLTFNGRAHAPWIAILGYGGVLGVGREYVAIDFNEMSITPTAESTYRIVAKLDVNRLSGKQKVTPPQYPELRLQTVRRKIVE